MRQLAVIFVSVFLAEIGDKTQLATMLFATDREIGKAAVFGAAALALLLSTLLAVLAGGFVTRMISPVTLKITAGTGFILIGLWTLATARS
jgi:putative Ca2+/H+ antiporter (TMEM165/GDT1 family)